MLQISVCVISLLFRLAIVVTRCPTLLRHRTSQAQWLGVNVERGEGLWESVRTGLREGHLAGCLAGQLVVMARGWTTENGRGICNFLHVSKRMSAKSSRDLRSNIPVPFGGHFNTNNCMATRKLCMRRLCAWWCYC